MKIVIVIGALVLAMSQAACSSDGDQDPGGHADSLSGVDSGLPDVAVDEASAEAGDHPDAGPPPLSCDTCHGDPPAPPHPPATAHIQCAWCHTDTVLPNGTIDQAGGHHENGAVESNKLHPPEFLEPGKHGRHFNMDGPMGCAICHGEDLLGGPSGASCETCHPGFRTDCTYCHGGVDNDTGAPPGGILGDTDISFVGVGAHTAHVATSPEWHKAYGCSECHAEYTDALDPGHMDGVAAVVWGDMAGQGGLYPTWEDGGCSAVYCHGAAFEDGGGAFTAPSWTTVDGTQATCGSCHALPPGGGHPQNADCALCHGCVATSDPSIRPEGAAFHINGAVNQQPAGACPTEE